MKHLKKKNRRHDVCIRYGALMTQELNLKQQKQPEKKRKNIGDTFAYFSVARQNEFLINIKKKLNRCEVTKSMDNNRENKVAGNVTRMKP